ncbi:MAG: ABC transporter permease [Cyclobacteriaceae bacterium]
MNMLLLSWRSIISKPLSSLLSWLLLTFGVLIVIMILLTSSSLKEEISKNTRGIDLVIGAKGSPLQLILANVFHVDFPTGNINLKEAAGASRSRYIERAIPVSLGDSYLGVRLVGTTKAYADLYEAELGEGEWYGDHMEVVIGSEVARNLGLTIGSEFQSQHGLSDDGDEHDAHHPFVVSGILRPSQTVIDKLILTSLQSIWEVHAHDEHHADEDSLMTIKHLGIEVSAHHFQEEDITALLVKYRSPMGAVMLPRAINSDTNFQAASPAFETARLFNIIGVGVDLLNMLGLLIIVISAMSVFLSLLNSLKERRYDIAIIRSMGGTRMQIFLLVLFEGMIITFVGAISGLVLAHVLIYALASSLDGINPDSLSFMTEEWLVLAGCIVIGILASMLPAFLAYKTNISETLAKG